jgi:hypothetical protein
VVPSLQVAQPGASRCWSPVDVHATGTSTHPSAPSVGRATAPTPQHPPLARPYYAGGAIITNLSARRENLRLDASDQALDVARVRRIAFNGPKLVINRP